MRWAEALTRRRRAQGYGPLRIGAELRAKGGTAGPDSDAADSARDPSGDEDSELARAVALLERRFPEGDLHDPQLRSRALRLLTTRGYPAGLAVRAAGVRARQGASGGDEPERERLPAADD